MISGQRILVIDRHAKRCGIVVSMLERMGCRTSSSPSEAVGLAKLTFETDATFDMVCLDAESAERNVFAFPERVRRTGHPRIKSILLFRNPNKGAFHSSMHSAFDAVAYEPITPINLCNAMRAAVQGTGMPSSRTSGEMTIRHDDAALLAGRRILFADDHSPNHEIIHALLETYKVVVDSAFDGNEVLQLLEDRAFDIVLMDIQMPRKDGVTTTRHIRRSQKNHAVPIIAFSASAMKHDIQQCLDAGFNDHIAKPLDPRDLMRKLCRWMPKAKGAPHGEGDHVSPHSPALVGEGDKPQLSSNRMARSRTSGAGPGGLNTDHADERQCSERVTDERAPSLAGYMVLIVEDSELNREFLEMALASYGATIVVAADGEEAVQRVHERAFDVVLMDMRMPVMDGMTATRTIRQTKTPHQLPIIAMTGNVLDESELMTDAGINDAIRKPCSIEDLVDTLQYWTHSTNRSGLERTTPSRDAGVIDSPSS